MLFFAVIAVNTLKQLKTQVTVITHLIFLFPSATATIMVFVVKMWKPGFKNASDLLFILEVGFKGQIINQFMSKFYVFPSMPVCYKWQEHLIPYRAVGKSNNFMGKRYVEVFESKAGEMEWTCKRMGQPQDRGNESVVRLRGLPFQVSKEEIAQFFTGKDRLIDSLTL